MEMVKTYTVGDTVVRRAMNGHLMEYEVIGFYHDGTPRLSQWDALHSDQCVCDGFFGEDW